MGDEPDYLCVIHNLYHKVLVVESSAVHPQYQQLQWAEHAALGCASAHDDSGGCGLIILAPSQLKSLLVYYMEFYRRAEVHLGQDCMIYCSSNVSNQASNCTFRQK